MHYKWIGAIMIIVSCGGFGFALAAGHLRDEKALRQTLSALDFMGCELQYRLTPLPELCRQTGRELGGMVGQVFTTLASELDSQVSADVESCVNAALAGVPQLPGKTRDALRQLGQTLGRFDLEGQLKGLEAVRAACREKLRALTENKEPRLRSYQTLGLCAGAALAILFI